MTAPGGVSETTRDLLGEVGGTWECFLLIADPFSLRLYRWAVDGRIDQLARWSPPRLWSNRRRRDRHRELTYEHVLTGLGIDVVHVRHLLGSARK